MEEVVEPHTYRLWPGLGQDLAGLLFWRFTVGLAVFSGVLAMAWYNEHSGLCIVYDDP